MKKIWSSTVLAMLICLAFSSCEDWLDVDSSANITQENLFSTPSGFETAVNGVYRMLGEAELYGKELTWGLASMLGHNYDLSRADWKYRTLVNGDTESGTVREVLDPIWEKGFRVIANCNNIIAHTEAKDASFFTLGEIEKDLILGEMRGVRALMHLQLLQLFAPAPAQDDGKPYMPYVEQYPEHQPEHISVNQILDKVIDDFEYAQAKLAHHDTIFNYYAFSYGVNERIGAVTAPNTMIKGGLFYSARATRMNYIAAKALQARAYLWKGDKPSALRSALDAYRFLRWRRGEPGLIYSGLSVDVKNWFDFTSLNVTDANELNRKMPNDIIFAAYNKKEYDIYINSVTDWAAFYYKNQDEIFKNTQTFALENDDWRYSKLIEGNGSSRRWTPPVPGIYSWMTPNQVYAYQGPLLPVIRMSEVIHIICECDQTIGQGAIYVLRYYRGIQGAGAGKVSENPTEYWNAVVNDVIRENMSEGRTFFFFKRLNLPVYNGTNGSVDMSRLFKIPPPYTETAYSNL